MGAAENKQVLQHAYGELGNGNSKPFVEALADHVRWTLMGATKWSRFADASPPRRGSRTQCVLLHFPYCGRQDSGDDEYLDTELVTAALEDPVAN
jgi:hypothetical protein